MNAVAIHWASRLEGARALGAIASRTLGVADPHIAFVRSRAVVLFAKLAPEEEGSTLDAIALDVKEPLFVREWALFGRARLRGSPAKTDHARILDDALAFERARPEGEWPGLFLKHAIVVGDTAESIALVQARLNELTPLQRAQLRCMLEGGELPKERPVLALLREMWTHQDRLALAQFADPDLASSIESRLGGERPLSSEWAATRERNIERFVREEMTTWRASMQRLWALDPDADFELLARALRDTEIGKDPDGNQRRLLAEDAAFRVATIGTSRSIDALIDVFLHDPRPSAVLSEAWSHYIEQLAHRLEQPIAERRPIEPDERMFWHARDGIARNDGAAALVSERG